MPSPAVTLVEVGDPVLAQLVEAATSRANADEVTPSLSGTDDWTPERVRWLEAFHRDRKEGLHGPAAEATWAVMSGGAVVGSLRLRRLDEGDFECGAWLVRDVRGRGVGTAALGALIDQARSAGATTLRADTGAANRSALGVLRRGGFDLTVGVNNRVLAVLQL